MATSLVLVLVPDGPGGLLGGVRFVAGERSWLGCTGEWEIRSLDERATLGWVGVNDCLWAALIAGGVEWSTAGISISRVERQE